MARRDTARMVRGKARVLQVSTGWSSVGELPLDDLKDAIYYLDGTLFLPRGGAKAGKLLRNEAKKRGVL